MRGYNFSENALKILIVIFENMALILQMVSKYYLEGG